jgi:hypothetical protein
MAGPPLRPDVTVGNAPTGRREVPDRIALVEVCPTLPPADEWTYAELTVARSDAPPLCSRSSQVSTSACGLQPSEWVVLEYGAARHASRSSR